MMDCHEELSEVKKLTIREEANAIVSHCFRSGYLEDLHAGKYCEILKDDSFSRITDDEMKKLMKESCEKVCGLLRQKEEDPDSYWVLINYHNLTYCRKWDK